MGKYLVAYYSRSGNTKVLAEKIQALTGADTFRIDTVRDYPADYHGTTEAAKKELWERARPELSETLGSIDGYDVIFLGYPNWWGTYPMAVATFLESFDFSGKTIVPFCTHEGTGMGVSERDIRSACPGAVVLDGLAVRGSSARNSDDGLQRWIEGAQL